MCLHRQLARYVPTYVHSYVHNTREANFIGHLQGLLWMHIVLLSHKYTCPSGSDNLSTPLYIYM